ncbi:MAG: adenylate/guanylate cyclase domain-containing protein [Ginsengibacter sp.]
MRDLKLGLKYAEELITLSTQKGNTVYLRRGYFLKGTKERSLGNLDTALDAYFKSAEVANRAHYLRGEGDAYSAIADIYSLAKNHPTAKLYYNKAIAALRQSNDSISLASAISNAGDEFLKIRKYDSALLYFRESKVIFDKINYLTGMGYSLGNIGMVYANIGENDLAEKNINEAIKILEQTQDYYPICVYLISMADVYLNKRDDRTALNYALRSLHLAKQYGLKEQIADANLKLSELYEKDGNLRQSLTHYRNYITYRDSISNINTVQRMADLRTNYEVSKKQVEVNMLNRQKRNQRIIVISLFIILVLTIVLLGTLYWYYKTISREKARSENLLLNILPAETAKELKQNGKVEAVKFDQVTVLFTDFVEFSKIAEHVEPEQLVKSVDFYFKKFDEITTKYGLEKIKTIGDSYMCACGLPTANPAHATNVMNAAKEMIDLVKSELNARDGISHFDIRMGMHTGPVVAGIVGIKKWQYDIWGDTVNIASRMESMSKPGRVNLSETTWHKIKDEFPCEYRGEIEVKNRGLLKMYFLS